MLKKDVAKYLHDPDCLTLAYQIIDSAPDPLGIPIGNQSSQIFALLYLNQLDHLCKEQLRFRYYGRYMDDFYIICESKERLQEALVVIRQHLAERGLELNQKTNIFPLRNGLDFLGFHTYIDDAGRVIRKVRKSSRDRMKRKLRKYAALYQRGEIDREKIAESYTSWRAHALHGDCRQLVAKYDQQFLLIFEGDPNMPKKINTLAVGAKVRDPLSKYYGVPVGFQIADKNHAGYPANSTTLAAERFCV